MNTVNASVLSALTSVLYPPESAGLHEWWRKLIGTTGFAHRGGLSHEERVHRAYRLLALVNESLADVPAFVADPEQLAVMHEWTGAVEPGFTAIAGIHYNLFLGSLLDLEPEGVRDLAEYTGLRETGTFLCTEVAHGNDAARLETTATRDPGTGDFVLHTPNRGAAKFMPNTSSAGGAKTGLVAARLLADSTDHGVHLFLTRLNDGRQPMPGVRIELLPPALTCPVDHAVTSFDQVRLPPEALLGPLPSGQAAGSGRRRLLHAIGRVTAGKLCMSACGVSAAKTAVALAVRHAHARSTAGLRPGESVTLFEHGAHQARLVDATVTAYAVTALHRYAVRRWLDAGPADRSEAERVVAITKGWTTWQGRAVAIECRERCGARGALRVNGFADPIAAIEGPITAEGDNLVIWNKAAAELSLGWRRPAVPRTEPDLADPAYLHGLLIGIEEIWHQRASRKLRDRGARSPLARWNATVGPALELVAAHAHRLAAEALHDWAERADGQPAREVLRGVHRLFALRRISGHDGVLLAAGRLTAEQVEELPDLIDRAVTALAPHTLTLVEAFGVPEQVFVPDGYQDER
ncbi:acyl-CoA dehydrogenase [Longispora albida]|uniref:acyl-CoA dehydrogenase family protein n=1 Tax=Longispora albida TaxID=203523 RepID=UPI000361F904|nr:acyl-CoA dehydrogenase [Longispora albida]